MIYIIVSNFEARYRNYKRILIRKSQIETQCSVMSSLQRPKKFSVIASNGQRYSFLAKNGDDLSLDARVRNRLL